MSMTRHVGSRARSQIIKRTIIDIAFSTCNLLTDNDLVLNKLTTDRHSLFPYDRFKLNCHRYVHRKSIKIVLTRHYVLTVYGTILLIKSLCYNTVHFLPISTQFFFAIHKIAIWLNKDQNSIPIIDFLLNKILTRLFKIIEVFAF